MPLVQAYYERTLKLNYYPPNGDSIAIPIAGDAIATIVFFPLLVLGLWLILRHFPAHCSWLAWNKNHPYHSTLWTGICGLLILQTIPYLQENWKIGLPRNALANVVWILVFLELRAVIISKSLPD